MPLEKHCGPFVYTEHIVHVLHAKLLSANATL